MLAKKYPQGLTSGQWASCAYWTHALHANCGYYPAFPTDRLRSFADELNTRLAGEVDIRTIDWIWDEYVHYARGGKQYSDKYRPTTPARLREARMHLSVSDLDGLRMMVHLRPEFYAGQLVGEEVTEARLHGLLNSPNLRRLCIAGPRVTDALLTNLNGLTSLDFLAVRGENLTDRGLSNLANMESLEELYLSGPKISDAGLACLKGLSKLKYLDLSGVSITDAGLVHLESLQRLEHLQLRGFLLETRAKVTADGAKSLHAKLPKCRIDR
jgi:Leucine-rich repeat (LRR) protein